jgi:hypothetical protein
MIDKGYQILGLVPLILAFCLCMGIFMYSCIKDNLKRCVFVAVLLALLAFPLSVLITNLATPPIVNLDNLQIEYKSIDPSNEEYYAIGKDGIYKVTPEEWWELDVPIIAETK